MTSKNSKKYQKAAPKSEKIDQLKEKQDNLNKALEKNIASICTNSDKIITNIARKKFSS